MFAKLAFKNVRRSLGDYSVYFLTLTFGVCIFYVFNSLDSQLAMTSLRGGTFGHQEEMDAILTWVDIFSVFVSVILGFLILYANHFMVKRRKKELGTYLLLGLSQGQTSALLLAETVVIGLFALAAGLALGVLVAQAFSAFTAGLFQITVKEFSFVFSWRAVGKTLLHFGVIFLVVMAFNTLTVSRQKLIDLLQGARRSEELKVKRPGLSAFLFLVGLVLLGVAYVMLLIRGLLQIDALFFLMLALGTAGTLLFFRGLSGFLLELFQRRKRLYYQGLNLFTLRQFAARIGSNYVSMTVICLMLLLGIGITACAVGMNNTIDARVAQQFPWDFKISATAYDEDGQSLPVDIPAALKAAGFDPAEWVEPAESETTEWSYQGNYRAEVDKQEAEAALQTALHGDFPHLALGKGGGRLSTRTRLEEYMEAMGTKLLLLFLGIYLGAVFLLCSGAVLALQQLSQAADNAPRYAILTQLGAEETLCRRSVDAQVALAFLLPLGLALVHAAVGMTAANAVITRLGRVDAVESSAVTALVLTAIYGGYFLLACLGSRRMAKGR